MWFDRIGLTFHTRDVRWNCVTDSDQILVVYRAPSTVAFKAWHSACWACCMEWSFDHVADIYISEMSLTTTVLFLQMQGGVILVSHDEHLINLACNEVWLCKNHSVYRLDGGLQQYKSEVENEFRSS